MHVALWEQAGQPVAVKAGRRSPVRPDNEQALEDATRTLARLEARTRGSEAQAERAARLVEAMSNYAKNGERIEALLERMRAAEDRVRVADERTLAALERMQPRKYG